jgi:REP element-mobilizing transposase RayT
MSYTCLYYHIVFSTKERRRWLTPQVLPRVCQYMGGIARNLKSQLLLADGCEDHVHLVAIAHPTLAIADFVGKVKANCTGWVHEAFGELTAFCWQEGYAAFTVSASVLPRVKAYVASQQEHHRKMSFQEELIALLDKHGIEYKEEHLWA